MTLARRTRRWRGFSHRLLRAGLVVAALGAAGAFGLAGPTQPASASTVLQPPAVPQNGAYIGAWVAPSQTLVPALARGGGNIDQEINQLNHFEAALGRPLGFVHVFQNWTGEIENRGLNAIAATGSIPMVNWAPPFSTTDNLLSIIQGKDDAEIARYADQLVRFGRPVFLRWFWEFNFPNSPRDESAYAGCQSAFYKDPAYEGHCFEAAWQRIYWIFKGNPAVGLPAPYKTWALPLPPPPPPPQGAYNVAFAWCPGIGGSYTIPTATPYLTDYFPGPKYVDWIGIDGYDRTTTPAAGGIDQVLVGSKTAPTDFYANFATYGKPMMIGETGDALCKVPLGQTVCQNYSVDVQSSFLTDMAAKLPTEYPLIHAVGYFDSSTNTNVWTLANEPGSPALTTLANIMATPYFSIVDP